MKAKIKHKYSFDIHFKRGNDEKDWIDMDFEAYTFEEAHQEAMNWTRHVSKSILKVFDNKKVFLHSTKPNTYWYLNDNQMTFVK